jgi:hypothetical protein
VSALLLLSLRSSFSPRRIASGSFRLRAWCPIRGRSPVSQTYSGAGSDVDLADRIGGAHGSLRAPLQLASCCSGTWCFHSSHGRPRTLLLASVVASVGRNSAGAFRHFLQGCSPVSGGSGLLTSQSDA